MFERTQISQLAAAATRGMMNRYPRIAFIHVPKCAGTSVSESLQTIYPMPLRAARFWCRLSVRRSALTASLIGVNGMMCRQAVLVDALSDPLMRFVTGHVYADPRVGRTF